MYIEILDSQTVQLPISVMWNVRKRTRRRKLCIGMRNYELWIMTVWRKKTLKILKNVLKTPLKKCILIDETPLKKCIYVVKTPLKKCIRCIRCGRRNSLTIQHIYYIGCCSEVIFLHYALFLGTVPELVWKSFSLPVYFMIALKRIII